MNLQAPTPRRRVGAFALYRQKCKRRADQIRAPVGTFALAHFSRPVEW